MLPPLALKMCAGCTRQYAVEGDVGDEQGGTTWYGPCCPVPPKYADVFIITAVRCARAVDDDDDERCCGIDGLITYVCCCDDGCECACPGCPCEG